MQEDYQALILLQYYKNQDNMILGIGTDLVNVNRISNIKFGFCAFLSRVYTASELEYISSKNDPYRMYALYFAAKEATAKAMGTGFCCGVYPRLIEICHCPYTSRPSVNLLHTAQQYLLNLIKPKLDFCIHVTLTDEYPMACATILIEIV